MCMGGTLFASRSRELLQVNPHVHGRNTGVMLIQVLASGQSPCAWEKLSHIIHKKKVNPHVHGRNKFTFVAIKVWRGQSPCAWEKRMYLEG